jgi:hypothetical protein
MVKIKSLWSLQHNEFLYMYKQFPFIPEIANLFIPEATCPFLKQLFIPETKSPLLPELTCLPVK